MILNLFAQSIQFCCCHANFPTVGTIKFFFFFFQYYLDFMLCCFILLNLY